MFTARLTTLSRRGSALLDGEGIGAGPVRYESMDRWIDGSMDERWDESVWLEPESWFAFVCLLRWDGWCTRGKFAGSIPVSKRGNAVVVGSCWS
jgi:hypothetical protein